jgi:hypothetical protein
MFYQLAMREACKYVEEKLSVKVKQYSNPELMEVELLSHSVFIVTLT